MLTGSLPTPDDSARQKRNALFYKGLLFLALFHLFVQLSMWLPLHWRPSKIQCDYQVYYIALQQLHAGAALYAPWPDYGPHLKPMPYNYPPPFIALLYPLGWLSELSFARFWYSLIVISFWIYAWCLARLVCPRATWDKILISGLFLTLCPGMIHVMSLGNVQPMLTALWGVAFAFPMRTLALATAASVKIHPIWPLTVSFFDGVKQVGWPRALKEIAFPALLFFAAAFLLGALVCGPQSYVRWLQNVPPVLSQGTFETANLSLPMGVLRLLRAVGYWHYEAGPLPVGPRLFLTSSTLCGPLFSWWLARRWSRDLRQAFVGSAVVLFAPLCWIDYAAIFLVPLCLWLRLRQDEKRLDIPS